MADIKNIESQQKFHHVFIGIVVALLGAVVQTAKFGSLGKYGLLLELAGWLLLLLSLVIAVMNAWNVQHLFFRAWEADRARTILEQKNIPPDTLLTAVEGIDRLNTIFAELEIKFSRRFKFQLAFFAWGIFCIALARGMEGIVKLKMLWFPG